MAATPIQEGNRVRSRVTRDRLKAGMVGTVQQVFSSVDDIYDVVFDSDPIPVLMRGGEMERLEQARSDKAPQSRRSNQERTMRESSSAPKSMRSDQPSRSSRTRAVTHRDRERNPLHKGKALHD